MERLNFEGPLNSLSLGNVSINFLKELIPLEQGLVYGDAIG